jgi:hypothetical protein
MISRFRMDLLLKVRFPHCGKLFPAPWPKFGRISRRVLFDSSTLTDAALLDEAHNVPRGNVVKGVFVLLLKTFT